MDEAPVTLLPVAWSFTKMTLAQLKSYLSEPVRTDRDRAGVIRAFEFTFEQCWRGLQKVAGQEGGQVGNARQAFTFAIQSGWIERSEEALWLRLIEDRNLTSHTYQNELAHAVLGRIQDTYVSLFEKLFDRLIEN